MTLPAQNISGSSSMCSTIDSAMSRRTWLLCTSMAIIAHCGNNIYKMHETNN